MSPMNYADYLHLDTLLSIQEPHLSGNASQPAILAENFFIVTHQATELWLKQIQLDLEATTESLTPPCSFEDMELSLELILRSAAIFRVLREQLLALETMPLRNFAEMRPGLDGASGSQSTQFRQLSELIGDEHYHGPVYLSFERLCCAQGSSVPEVCGMGLAAGVLHRIAEALMDLGNGYWRWRIDHGALVSKMIGSQSGTGGTSGVDFLLQRATLPFQRLRQARSQVHDTWTSET